jgi:hypothetical protein
MKENCGKGRALLVGFKSDVYESLKADFEQSGHDVFTISGFKKAEHTAVLLKDLKFDLVAVSTTIAGEEPGTVSKLHQALNSPVVVYQKPRNEADGVKTLWYLKRLMRLNSLLKNRDDCIRLN